MKRYIAITGARLPCVPLPNRFSALAISEAEDITGLDVTMNDAGMMQMTEPAANATQQRPYVVIGRERFCFTNVVRNVAHVGIFHQHKYDGDLTLKL